MTDVFAESCLVSWKTPEDDGGSPISGYVVEAMDLESRGKWKEVGNATSDQLSFKCATLKEGHKYKFRVRAKNRKGVSGPAEAKDAVLAKNPWGPPGPPIDLEVADWDKDRVDLKWRRPLEDGGAPITGKLGN